MHQHVNGPTGWLLVVKYREGRQHYEMFENLIAMMTFIECMERFHEADRPQCYELYKYYSEGK